MGESLRQVCALSVLCGVILNLTPKGGVKRVMTVLCAAALICAVLTGIRATDMEEYRLALSQVREQEAALEQNGADLEERLNRLVIEEQLRAYILDKAAQYDLVLRELQLTLDWSLEGMWVPGGVSGRYQGTEDAMTRLVRILEAELGIPAGEQNWSADD